MDCNCQKSIKFSPGAFVMTDKGFEFQTEEIVPTTQETPLEKMYRTSFETANAENNRLSAKLSALQASVDSKDLTIARASERMLWLEERQVVSRAALANAEFERDWLLNHPLMRFVRWMKGWD